MRIRTRQRDDGAGETGPESQPDVTGVDENAAPAPPRRAGSPQPWINAHVLSHQIVSKKILNHRVLSFQVAGHDLFSKEVLSSQALSRAVSAFRLPRSGAPSSTFSDRRKP